MAAAGDAAVVGRWDVCLGAHARLEAALVGDADVIDAGLARSLLVDLWKAVTAHTAAQDERHARASEALRLARNECVSLQRVARDAHDSAAARAQQAACTATELRMTRDDSQAAFARQLELRTGEEARWKAEYAEQMQGVVSNSVRHAREAAQLQHTAALEAALAHVSSTYKAQLSAADASLAELQFHLAAAVQARDGAASRLAGALAERDGAAAETRSLRAELAAVREALRDLDARHRELRAELRYRDSVAAAARSLERGLEQLSLAKHGVRGLARDGPGREASDAGRDRVASSTSRGTDAVSGARQKREDGGGSETASGSEALGRNRHVSYADASE